MSAASATFANTAIGRSSPLGASVVPGGVNFSVYSRSASGVDLLLFDRDDDTPNDIVAWWDAPIVPGFTFVAGPRSVVALHTEVSE
ncbi:MAG: hypothetical protein JO099_15660 [Acidobacteriia bacterium]|nr:hypothetical protein [Terriglobia bacterium]